MSGIISAPDGSEVSLDGLLDAFAEPIFLAEPAGRIIASNAAARLAWGAAAMPGCRLGELFDLSSLKRTVPRQPVPVGLPACRDDRERFLGTVRGLTAPPGASCAHHILLQAQPRQGAGFVALTGKVRELQKENEARQATGRKLSLALAERDLLVRELKHRISNLFAVVLSLLAATGRDGDPAGRKLLDVAVQRVRALKAAQDLTAAVPRTQTAGLTDLVRAVVVPVCAREGDIEVDGPAFVLGADRMTPMSLLLHELATNAVKYGALSKAGGRIRIAWSVETGEGGACLVFDWTEDLPAQSVIGPPQKAGFGSTLIEHTVAQLGGDLHRDWRPNGLHVQIRLHPAPQT